MKINTEYLMVRHGLSRNQAEDTLTKVAELKEAVDSSISLKLQSARLMKKVAMSEPVKAVLYNVGAGVAAAAGGAAASWGIDKVIELKNIASRGSNIKAMQKAHPELQQDSPKDLHLAYNTLSRVAPDTVSDPLLGGQFIKYVVTRNDVPVDMLHTIGKTVPAGHKDMQKIVTQTLTNTLANSGQVYQNAANALEQRKLKEQEIANALEQRKLKKQEIANAIEQRKLKEQEIAAKVQEVTDKRIDAMIKNELAERRDYRDQVDWDISHTPVDDLTTLIDLEKNPAVAKVYGQMVKDLATMNGQAWRHRVIVHRANR